MKMMKKALFVMLIVVIVACFFAFSASAETTTGTYGVLSYSITDGEVTITHCETTATGALTIPDSIEGYPVVSIGNGAFEYCCDLTEITVPDSVTFIDEYAFSECCNLEDIVLSESLTYIGSFVFNQCSKLKEIYIPVNVETLFSDAFTGCCSLEKIDVDEKNEYYSSENGVLFNKEKSVLYRYPAGKTAIEYSIPDGVEIIAEDAFHANVNLEYINIPDGVKKIGDISFVHCTKLKELTIPDSVTSMGNCLMLYCISLETLTLGENVDRFYAENALYTLSLKDLYVYNTDIVFDEKSAGYIMADTNAPFDEFVNYFTLWMYDAGTYNDYIQSNMIWYDSPQPIDGFTIHGYEGSTAETYANENGFKFVPICRHNYIDSVITAPTYTQVGEGGEVCEYCGDVLSTYEIPMFQIENSEEKEDSDTGVSVIFPDGTFEEDVKVEIEVTPVEDGEAYKLINHKEGNYKVTMFDINLTVDGEKVQPNGTVLVKIPLPNGYNQNKCVVYYVAEDGTMEELKTYHYKDGYIYFETNHFSNYAVLEETEETEETDCFSKLKDFFDAIIDFFTKLIGQIKNMFNI